MPCFFPLSGTMAYEGKTYFVKTFHSLIVPGHFSLKTATLMCNSESSQIVVAPENEDRTKAILAFLLPIAKKVGSNLQAWATCSGTITPCGTYVVHQTNPSGTYFGRERPGYTHPVLALCERGELTINTTLGPCDRT